MPSNNSGALVVHDPNQGRQGRQSGGQNRRRPQGGGQQQRRRPQQQQQRRRPPPPQWENDDDVSDVSDADYDPEMEEPRFKYSTAELRNAPCLRNQNCCIGTVIVICIIFAIICSIVYKVVVGKLSETDPPTLFPTMAPSLSQAPSLSFSPSLTPMA